MKLARMGSAPVEAFAELRTALCWADEEIVLALWSYFDESGHSKDPNVSDLAVGGCISTVRGWFRFVPDWLDALSAFAVSHLHTKDFAHGKGEFAGWDEERRRKFLARLVGLMNRDIDAYIGRVMPLPDEWRRSPDELTVRLKDPYYGCLLGCIEAALSHSRHSCRGAEVNVVLAHHPEYSGWANDIFQSMREELDGGDRLGSLSFDSPVKLVQLQAADLVSYELQHYVTGRRRGRSQRRWAMDQFLTKPHYFKQIRLRGSRPRPQ